MPGRSCKIDVVLEFISEPWTLAVIHQLSIGPRRTVELFSSFNGLSTKTLGARLKKLERGGIIARKSFSEAPPRVEYSLTEKGRALLRVIDAIADVADEWDCDGESRVAVASCRACHTDQGESADQSAAPIKPRKRTDVTLL
ncbi:MAG TPA: helix-turn-helix domain-containing protein [Blastocatellia bacterium]|nr:helix-turn-helix domain-containing protein [Blastocatellia bacterium]